MEKILVHYKVYFGAFGALLTLYALYNSYQILGNFKEKEDIALSMFFLNKQAVKKFKVLAHISLIYSGIAFLVVFNVVPDSYPYDIAVLLLFSGITYFLKGIKEITSGAGDKESFERNRTA